VRQIFPDAGPDLELFPAPVPGELPTAVRQLADLYRNGSSPGTQDRPWLRANMIASADGASALGGRSGGLGGPADRMVFTVLRSLADVILVGAGTARAEHYRPVQGQEMWAALRADRAPTTAIAVVTRSLDLEDCARLLTASPPDAETILITSAAAPADQVAALGGQVRVLTAGQSRVDLGQAVAALGELGYQQILAEGGPNLLGQLTKAGLLDELCLTISPLLAAGSASRIAASASDKAEGVPVTLAHVLTDAGFLITRYIRPAG
jgi:riboflavin biosynthesis pyrimidine reductase